MFLKNKFGFTILDLIIDEQTCIFYILLSNYILLLCCIPVTCIKISNNNKARRWTRGKRTIRKPYGCTLNKQYMLSTTERSARSPFIFQCFRAFSLLSFLYKINEVEGCLLWTLSCRYAVCALRERAHTCHTVWS